MSTLGGDQVVRRNPRTAWRRVVDEVLIVSSDRNCLTILNDTGAWLWERLDVGRSIQDLAALIQDEFEVDGEQAARDVRAFVEDLQQRQLLLTEG